MYRFTGPLLTFLVVIAAQGQSLPASLHPGDRIQVELDTGDHIEGVLVSATPLTLQVRTLSSGERIIPFDAVAVLRERRPAPGRGAWRGALAGSLFVGGGGLAFNYAACDYDCDRGLQALVGTAVGAGVGALVGAGWGAARGRWVQRFP